MNIPKTLAIALALLVAAGVTSPVNAQIIRYRYGNGTITEQESSTIPDTVPRVIERRVFAGTIPQVQVTEPRGVAEPLVTLQEERRSNYSKRLADVLEQITFAYSKGWLSRRQYDDLRQWHASVAMEELALRQAGGGIVRRSDVDQLERHMNGLAYTVNREIEEGSKVASSVNEPM